MADAIIELLSDSDRRRAMGAAGLQRLTIGGSSVEDAPTWSPDGRSILYTRVYNDIRERRIVDLDGGNDRELPGHGQVCYAPQWVAHLAN